jgi:hypothetical protein
MNNWVIFLSLSLTAVYFQRQSRWALFFSAMQGHEALATAGQTSGGSAAGALGNDLLGPLGTYIKKHL